MARKGTPEELDFFFDRDVIEEDEYRTFWPKWYKASRRGKDKIIQELEKRMKPSERPKPPTPTKGKITKSLQVAKREAKKLGGYIVRRDRFGRFNPRGRTYQAVVKKSRKK